MASISTLAQLAVGKATTFTEQIDNLTENAPIVKAMPFVAASDQLWDVASELVMADSPVHRVDMNAPLQEISLSESLKQTPLNIFGAKMFVPEDRAKLEGGPDRYFARHRRVFERQTGMDIEKTCIYSAWLPFARAQHAAGHTDCVQDAGGTGARNYSLLVLRFDEVNLAGLYSPLCFNRATFLDMSPINGGQLYENPDIESPFHRVLGYGLRMKTWLGMRMLSHRNVGAVVNIDLAADTPLTPDMVENAMLAARVGEAGRAMLVCHPRVRLALAAIGKTRYMQAAYGERQVDLRVDTWDGVPIVTSYNFLDGGESRVEL